MNEYYTFPEAREKAQDGDKLYLKEETGETWIKVGALGRIRLSWKQYDSDRWQIIPAEPKVLSVDEAAEKYLNFSNADQNYCMGWRTGFFRGHSNGRLERDLELRPAIDLIEKRLSKPVDSFDYPEMLAVIRKIKPLKQDDWKAKG